MNEQAALRVLQKYGMAHTPDSLQRLIADGRVTATGSVQQGNVVVDEASLRAYVQQFQKALKTLKHGGFSW